MKKLFYVRRAMITLFEAYPDDPKEGWMPKAQCRGGHEIKYPGKYDSLSGLLAAISPTDTYYPIDKWKGSDIEDGRFLMTIDVLVDYNEHAPGKDVITAWKNGKAQLYHGYFSVDVLVQRIENVSADEIKRDVSVKTLVV